MFITEHPIADVSAEALAELCRQYHIKRLSAFGSSIREDFGPESDIDLLVEFEDGHTPGWEIVDLQDLLSKLFGYRKIDIVNPKYLNKRIKDQILSAAVVQYESDDGA